MTVGSRVKQTLADLKGIENTLNVYSLKSSSKEESRVFKEAFETVEKVSKNIEKRLKKIELEEPQYKQK